MHCFKLCAQKGQGLWSYGISKIYQVYETLGIPMHVYSSLNQNSINNIVK